MDIKTRDETKNQINKECISVYEKKIDLYNIILERMEINYKKTDALLEHKKNLLNPENIKKENFNIKYELEDDIKKVAGISELNAYLPDFIFSLFNQPKITSKLLLSANSKDMKETLSDFFCHNLYENILSPNYIEHNLLFLISFLLKEEINNMDSKILQKPEKNLEIFLNNSTCGYILEQFQKNKDVQIFFKTILLNVIENLELSSANKEMIFDLNKIEEEIITKTKSRENNDELKKVRKTGEEYISICLTDASFNNDYTFIDICTRPINLDYLKNLMNNYKDNSQMIGYLLYHMGKIENKKDIYNPDIFIKKDLEDNINVQLINEYQRIYDTTINLINELFKNLINNLYLLPYSIKCICKIIFSFIQKKFQKLNVFHQYALMAKFFFGKLFSPIFQDPGLGALINTFIISTTTIKNLEIISKIINNFVSGNLYQNNKEEESFMPFNIYFIEKMPELIQIFEGILKVELPSFIENFINDNLPEDFEYNFFQENPDEVVFHKSACFTVEDIYLIIELMEKNSKNIFPKNKNLNEEELKLKKTFEKLSSRKNKDILKNMKNNTEYEILKVPIYHKKKKEITGYKQEKGRKIIKYYLITELLFNEKFSNIFNVKQNTKYFNLPIIKNMSNEEENIKNNIIKVKNFFCTILYNYRMLVKTDFEEGTTENTISILTELKKFMKSSNNIIDGTFPSQWFVNSLLDYLNKIPKNLVEDDCEYLIKDIQNDVSNAIKLLNFEELSVLIDKMKFANRGKVYYENAKNLVIDIYLNKKAQSIVEKEIIEVEILMKYNNKNKELKIEPPKKNEKHLNYLDSVFEEPKKKSSKICNTIKLFTKNFPNLIKYQDHYNIDVLKIEKELEVPKKLNSYFKMVREHIKNNLNQIDEKEILKINDKIFDFVMEKLYEKLFPTNPNEKDEKISYKCEEFSWVQPKHFIEGKKNYDYDSFLPDLTYYLMLITKEKSIRKKFYNSKLIFECMQKLGKFSGEKEFGIDEQIKILNYVFIKAKPPHMYANCEFMELFIGNKTNEIEGQNLAELKVICERVAEMSVLDLNNVQKEELDEHNEANNRYSHYNDLEAVI